MAAVVAGVAADRDDGLSDGSSRWEILRNMPAHTLEKKRKEKKEELGFCSSSFERSEGVVCGYLFYWTSSLLGPTLHMSWEDSADSALHAWISRFLLRSPTPLLACTFG